MKYLKEFGKKRRKVVGFDWGALILNSFQIILFRFSN